MCIAGACPDDCGATYHSSFKNRPPGHSGSVRSALILKIKECFDIHDNPSEGEAAALRLITQKGIFHCPEDLNDTLTWHLR